MLKILIEKWDKNKEKLREFLQQGETGIEDYAGLVAATFEIIYNTDEIGIPLDVKKITTIDDGDYQGTQLFLIPFNKYQPEEYDYLMTYVGYGSCSGCDTFEAIGYYGNGKPDESQVNYLMILCKDILQNTIKPYNTGWREDEKWKHSEINNI